MPEFNDDTFAQFESILSIKSQDFDESAGATVTQGDITGILKTTLGNNSTSVVIITATYVEFNDSDVVNIGSDTVLAENITFATSNEFHYADNFNTSPENVRLKFYKIALLNTNPFTNIEEGVSPNIVDPQYLLEKPAGEELILSSNKLTVPSTTRPSNRTYSYFMTTLSNKWDVKHQHVTTKARLLAAATGITGVTGDIDNYSVKQMSFDFVYFYINFARQDINEDAGVEISQDGSSGILYSKYEENTLYLGDSISS
jgi:hypothetical protein